MASIYDNCFCIPLDLEILESSLPLYQYGLGSHLTYELTFANYSDVIKSMDPDATYTISNISLEFDTIINASLASQIRTEYMKAVFYMIESLELTLFHSTILTRVSLLISIAHRKVSKVYYSFSRKKGAPLNLPVILKNSLTLK